MKKKKIIKILLLIMLIILILLGIHTIRNFIIIKSLQNNIEKYVVNSNYHIRSITAEENSIIETINYYKKDEKETMIVERNLNGDIAKISTYAKGEKTDVFYETKHSKIAELDTEKIAMISVYNCLETNNNIQTFIGSITAKISKTEYKGKQCYIVSNFLSPLFLNGKEINQAYIEKETGLCVKAINDSIVTEREYGFGNINDDIFIEPDIRQYKIQENNK